MTRVPSYPFRVIVKYKAGENNIPRPDQQKNLSTLAGVEEFKTSALKWRGVQKIETWVCIDETQPHIPQLEPARITQVSHGTNERTVVSHDTRSRKQ